MLYIHLCAILVVIYQHLLSNMNIRELVVKQYRDIIDINRPHAKRLSTPPEGWLRTIRKALKMPAKVIMSRTNITKSELYRIERAEVDGTLTLNTLKKMAKAMDCDLHYVVVPRGSVQSVLEQKAYQHAKRLVGQASTQMQLEAQTVVDEKTELQIQLLANQLISEMPDWFWTEQ